ncbi:acyl carrier protein [Amycolatopsis oliviviridis]|uniref:Actinorhodin polyketide synthase acyl carrier protein n=1 Tax=Amycolatopsis oliviviridis TaxID=1471590 RepID=A0ABQ3L5Q7_9PSEU|nr:acyl carrier protein [Amycolatopsis oliviviridis]GHH05363.1 actinorhodin polyketide synthase acyl carrier protein [Amycolatopsis oliviviridis]
MTKAMSLDNLGAILAECSGEDTIRLEGAARTPFDDLGYDSLALIETAAQLKLAYGVVIRDEQILEVTTPEELLELINRQLAAA